MICPKCNANVKESAKFCTNCGAKLLDVQMAKEEKEEAKPTPEVKSSENSVATKQKTTKTTTTPKKRKTSTASTSTSAGIGKNAKKDESNKTWKIILFAIGMILLAYLKGC